MIIFLRIIGTLWSAYHFYGVFYNWGNPLNMLVLLATAALGLLPWLLPRKKKTPVPTEVPDSSSQIITDEEVAQLVQQGYQEALEYKLNSTNPKFHRTDKEDELSYQFSCAHGELSIKKSDAFEDLYRQAFTADDLPTKISLLRQTILKFEEVRQWHYKKSKGATIYFQDMWEYLHNAQNPCYSWVDLVRDYLEQCEKEYNVIIPSIIEAIKLNEGILQKDIYKYVDADKSSVQRIIRNLCAQNIISRTKKGSTYTLSTFSSTTAS